MFEGFAVDGGVGQRVEGTRRGRTPPRYPTRQRGPTRPDAAALPDAAGRRSAARRGRTAGGYPCRVRDESVGIYLHVPFCERVCPYCDFAVVAARPLARDVEDRYVAALLAELAARSADFEGLWLASIYLGGGTPGLLHPDSVARLVDAVRSTFPAGAEAPEVTLEANPSSVERSRLAAFRRAGVNRLSVGIQSFEDAVLKRLGRAHRAVEGHAFLTAAREAAFVNVSLDLIVAVPDQTSAQLEADLDAVVAHGPEHVSVYGLTVEDGTPYARGVASGVLRLPDEERAAGMLERVPRRLAEAGIEAYEISSFARPGFESVHNRRYWERRPVLGLGMGAWSVEPRGPSAPHGARQHNPRDLRGYLERVEAGLPAAANGREVLAPATARGEAVFLALRTRTGLQAAAFTAEFGAAPRAFFAGPIREARAAGLLEESPGGDLRLTARGRMLSDTVFAGFVEGPFD